MTRKKNRGRQATTAADAPAIETTRPDAGATAPSVAAVRSPALEQWLAPLLLVLAGLFAYHNSLDGAFVFDDARAIPGNPGIRHLWPLWDAMQAPANSGVTSRPIVTLSLALSYAVDALDVRAFHLTNLAIHIVAGLLLYGIVRRMFAGEKLRARYGVAAPWLALATSAIWLVHPLQTESVAYIIQRAESLMGLFYLLTLYCVIRGQGSAHPRRWYVGAVIACVFGMGTKEVMVTAPIVVLLYDRMFLDDSFRRIFRLRWGLYVGLAATWLVLGVLLVTMRVEDQTVLLAGLTPWTYAITQFGVIVHYLRLSFWPDPLVLDYMWPLANSLLQVVPWAIVVLVLLGMTAWALLRGLWLGFWGAWFFLILAPTSSVLPIADAAFEHRMYLPLAAVAVLAVAGGHSILRLAFRRASIPAVPGHAVEAALASVLVAALAAVTVNRNDAYRNELVLYSDIVAKRPDNPRAHNNLGVVLNNLNRAAEGEPQFAEAVRIKPDFAEAQSNLGAALLRRGAVDDAIVHLSEAVRLKPQWAEAQHNLGLALLEHGDVQEAVEHLSRAVTLRPNYAEAQGALGTALAKLGRTKEAATHLAQSARLDPGSAQKENELANALYLQGKVKEAIVHYKEAVRLNPAFAEAHHNLGLAAIEFNDTDEAIAQFTEAIRLKPDYAKARNNLGIVLFRKGRRAEAAAQFAEAVRLQPDFAEAANNLRATQAGQPQGAGKP